MCRQGLSSAWFLTSWLLALTVKSMVAAAKPRLGTDLCLFEVALPALVGYGSQQGHVNSGAACTLMMSCRSV
jgi:hypothetical protein